MNIRGLARTILESVSVGDHWPAAGGDAEVVHIDGERIFVHYPGHPPSINQIYREHELDRQKKIDAQEARKHSEKQAASALPAEVSKGPSFAFVSHLTPMQQGKVASALTAPKSLNGHSQPIHKHVEDMVHKGYRVSTVKGERRLSHGDTGAYFREKDLGKWALDYAEWLTHHGG